MDNRSEVIDLNGEPEENFPLRDIIGRKDIGQPGHEGSGALPNQSLGKKPDGDDVLTISEGVPAVAQSALSAPSRSQLDAITSLDPSNADPISNLRALRVQKGRSHDFNDSLWFIKPTRNLSKSKRYPVLPIYIEKKAANTQRYHYGLASSELGKAERKLDLAMFDKRYPSQAASIENTEVKVLKERVVVEEKRLELYEVFYSSEAGEHRKKGGNAVTKTDGAPSVTLPSCAFRIYTSSRYRYSDPVSCKRHDSI